MAMDERRSSFSITRWANASKCTDALEVWFSGVHSDVGGGYANSDLSYGALKWMMDESSSKGLAFRKDIQELIYANPLGVMHNSYKGVFSRLRSRPRNIPEVSKTNSDKIHSSVFIRKEKSPLEYPLYHRSKILKVGESLTVEIFADTRWNETELYMDENQSIDFVGTKRVENMKWFTMVGAIANDSGASNIVTNDGSAVEHQYVDLTQHEKIPLVIKNPGYLYCFANDVWSLYKNNHGSVYLTITRTK